MRKILLLAFLIAALALAQATLKPEHGTLDGQGVYDLLIAVQLEADAKRPQWRGKVQLTVIAPKIADAKVLEALDKLSHGWADCSKAVLGFGCNMIPPLPVQVITGEVNRENWRTLVQPRWYKDDLLGRMVAAEVWLLPGEIKSGFMLLETPKADSFLSGAPLAERAGSVSYYSGPSIRHLIR